MKWLFFLIIFLLTDPARGQLICRELGDNCLLESEENSSPVKRENIFGSDLKICSESPKTGFFRTGYCESDERDKGNHSVCAVMTEDFLQYTLDKGNDLISANTKFGFPGLKPGDRWCLCAARWLEAKRAGVETQVIPQSTHKRALDVISLRFFQKTP